jgi:DUF1680 family protein
MGRHRPPDPIVAFSGIDLSVLKIDTIEPSKKIKRPKKITWRTTMLKDYPVRPIPFTDVRISDTFWSPRQDTNRRVTIRCNFQKCEETGRIANFDLAAGRAQGSHTGLRYDDSDVFKSIEGAAYSLSQHPDPDLESYLDDLIRRIAAAQEEDGYLFTKRTVEPGAVEPKWEGAARWSALWASHELYNVGHLYEAAVAYAQATGTRALLDVALKNANLIDSMFGPDNVHDVPGHQEIEIGLVKLYHETGDERYVRLAEFFLDERGKHDARAAKNTPADTSYMQDHQPVIQQTEAVGHAVRATYMYAAMVDIAAILDSPGYANALDRLWNNVVSQKLHLTGGIGARREIEGFGAGYELPNATTYNETCAAIGNILWNHRMFLLTGKAKYIDVLERTLYNGFLSGVSFEGNTFFYPNPLESDGEFAFNGGGEHTSPTRMPWFHTACCPPNIARLMASLGGYTYALHANRLYVNLFIGGSAAFTLDGQEIQLLQETEYPWQGTIKLTVIVEVPTEFTLCIRMPGWARNQPIPSDLYRYLDPTTASPTIRLGASEALFDYEGGYMCTTRLWFPGDTVVLTLPMPVHRVVSHDKVTANAGLAALERGPLVYCVEGVDHDGTVAGLTLPDDAEFTTEHRPDLLNGVTVIRDDAQNLTGIPYYAWSHRGIGPMKVWLPRG